MGDTCMLVPLYVTPHTPVKVKPVIPISYCLYDLCYGAS
jgi:hypothetical protein